jgi:transcriptional regulator with XRE-family HTH domain
MEELRRLRKEKGLSQAKLAVMAGLDPSTVSQIETGARRANTRTLERLAAALGAEVADLFPKAQPRLLEAFTVGGQPTPTLKLEDLPEEARTQLAERGFSDPYFVPLEEGEEEDTVTLEFRYVRLLEEDEPILKAMRQASPEEVEKIRQQLEKAGRTNE